jgi:hypothetical protein
MCVPHDMVKLCFILLVSCCIARSHVVLHTQVRNQDAIFLLRGVSSGAHEVAWQWLKVFTAVLIFLG